ncbi:Chitotriosidase-1 [Lasiodiplodia theobromae]|uniref:chitinase n=1 Tax=Lasiodiplodia theobromae TaxID=45133 RepID=A0A5N5CTQ8_9PEZI|nr:Chitotriosidase-1 [Lasiodiplodia theobromae]
MMVQSQSFLRYFLPFLILQFLSLNQVLASLGPSGKSAADVQQRIIGYYPGFNHNETCGMEFDKIPAENFTHLNFAFGYINNSTFEIEPKEGHDAQLFSNFTSIRSRNKDVKLMISLAQLSGNSTSVFSSIVASSCNRQKFIERLICFMNRYCFDGVDFDWEFPGDPATGGNNSDRDNYVLLVKELRSTLAQIPNKDFVISFTAPTPTYYLGMYNLTEMMKYADFINFMAYDVVNANWGTDKHIYAHTNLTEINKSLTYLLDNGVPSTQINLGLAFYGNSYQLSDTSCAVPGCPFQGPGKAGSCSEAGVLTYKDIMGIIQADELAPQWDTAAAVKYIHWDNDQWVAYDDKDTFKQKIEWGNGKGLGGVLIWSINDDDQNLSALRGVVDAQALIASNTTGDGQ